MAELAEMASFRGDDEPSLVRAALACRRCLSGAVDWSLQFDEWEAQAECACRDCGHRRVMILNAQQALRLYLHRRIPLSA